MRNLRGNRRASKVKQEQGSAYVGNRYPYEKLPTPTSIRLLEFEPIQDGLPRAAKMHVVDLNDNPEYTALSYTWGTRDGMQTCICDGHQMKITQNLAAFLQRFRGDGLPPTLWYQHEENIQTLVERVDTSSNFYTHLKNGVEVLRTSWPRPPIIPNRLWIDSLCIDQENPVEVSQQIPLMGDIYRKAGYVNVWLGEHSGETIVSPMQAITILVGVSWCQNHTPEETGEEWSSIALHTQAKLKSLYPDMSSVHRDQLFHDVGKWKLLELMQMLDLPWFTRAWTYQESNLASRRLFSLGPYCLLADHLQAAICCLEDYLFMIRRSTETSGYSRHGSAVLWLKYACFGGKSPAYEMNELRWDGGRQVEIRNTADVMLSNRFSPNCCHKSKTYHNTKEESVTDKPLLHELLAMRRGARCAVESDCVYSLLGLASDSDGIVADVTDTWQAVFVKTAIHLLQTQTRSLSWLFHQAGDQSEVIELPSWVPDWRSPASSFQKWVAQVRLCPGTFRYSVKVSDCNRRLHVQGYIEDVIDRYHYAARILNFALTKIVEPRSVRERDYDLKLLMRDGARVFVTKRGQVGVGSSRIRPDDKIAVIWGVCAPLVIRPQKEKFAAGEAEVCCRGGKESLPSAYRYIGECYIFGPQAHEHTDPNPSEFDLEPIVPEGREEVTIVLE